ncbi:MAG: outer membrane beta-barrel protein [Sediminibacterium sp.]
MPDREFDDFVGRQLSDLSARVPDGMWQRLNEQQMDQFFRDSLSNLEVPVHGDNWQRLVDTQFDNHVADQLVNFIAPVPSGAYEQLDDTRLDRFFGNSLYDLDVKVPDTTWDKVAGALLDTHAGDTLEQLDVPVPDAMWDKVADNQFDSHLSQQLTGWEAPVPAGLFDKIADEQFDQHFQAGLTAYEAPVSEALWEKVKPKEKDDRGFFFWFRIPMAAAIIGVLFLGGIMASYILYKNQSKAPIEQPGTVVSGDVTGNVPPKAPGKEASQQPDENRSFLPPTSIDSVDTKSKRSLSPLAENELSPAAGSTHGEKPVTGKVRNWLGWSKNKNNTQVTSGFKVTGVTDEKKQNAEVQEALTAQQTSTERIPAFDQPVLPILEEENYKSYPYGSLVATERNTRAGLRDINALSTKQISLPKITCPPVRSRNKWDDFNKDWYLDTYVSPDYSIQSINNLSASQQYLRLKDSSERMQVGFTAGLRLVKPLNDHVQFTTGVQYQQINQKHTYRTENEIKITSVISIRTIIRSPGDTITVIDTSQVQTVGFKNNVVKNRFRSIDIPVLLGYQFGRGSVKVGINAGVILNATSWYEGVVLDSSLAVVEVPKGSQVFKNKLGLSLYTGVQITKELSKEMQVYVEPYYRHSFDNVTTGSLPYHQKFGTAGVMVGVRWSLNRK